MRSFERAQASVGGSTWNNSKAGLGINLGLRVWAIGVCLVRAIGF